jgi:hypothetical protein
VAKQRRTEKRPRVPQEQRTPPRGVGREQPKAHSSGYGKSKKSKGPGRAPKARRRLKEKTSRKVGKPSRR